MQQTGHLLNVEKLICRMSEYSVNNYEKLTHNIFYTFIKQHVPFYEIYYSVRLLWNEASKNYQMQKEKNNIESV